MVQGYKLYADTGRNDPPRLVFDGSNNPQITEFTFDYKSNLGEAISSQLWYRF